MPAMLAFARCRPGGRLPYSAQAGPTRHRRAPWGRALARQPFRSQLGSELASLRGRRACSRRLALSWPRALRRNLSVIAVVMMIARMRGRHSQRRKGFGMKQMWARTWLPEGSAAGPAPRQLQTSTARRCSPSGHPHPTQRRKAVRRPAAATENAAKMQNFAKCRLF